MMGWLSKLFGGKPTKLVRLEGDGDYECEVVGESHYQDALGCITGGKTEDGHELECEALLEREPHNRNDPNAITVRIDGKLVGYLPRHHAKAMTIIFNKHELAGAYADAVIVGGWSGRKGRKAEGHFGVRLDIPVR